MSSASGSKKLTKEEIVQGFDRLLYDQRAIAAKINELKIDQREHRMVMKVLRGCDTERTGYRLIDGVLVEGKVKDILPDLQQKEEKMGEFIENFKKQLDEKGRKLLEYQEEHKIRIVGDKNPSEEEKKEKTSSGIIVS